MRSLDGSEVMFDLGCIDQGIGLPSHHMTRIVTIEARLVNREWKTCILLPPRSGVDRSPLGQPDPGANQAKEDFSAMSGTFASIAQWLTPVTTTNPGTCVPGDTTLCLGAGGRFKVEA